MILGAEVKNSIKRMVRRTENIYRYLVPAIKHVCLSNVGFLINKNKDIWLFSERGTEARDNSFHMFRYVREKHPEINAYYIISKDSSDRERLVPYGNIIDYGTLKHYLMFYGATHLISTHIMGCSPNLVFYYWMLTRKHIKPCKGHTVFLQHGVIKDNMPQCYQEKTQLDLFICGAKPEYEYIANNWHYKNNEVIYTGLARYDKLHDFETKRQILIMPTWRKWLVFGLGVNENDVASSNYVACWQSLLNDDRLEQLGEKYNIQFVFYPHYEMQRYLSYFASRNKHVVIADFDHYDVQQLLKESMLLITDYSSVFFDFAYMKKPMLYYQFDEEEFFSKHYEKGYFEYRRDGFGEVITDEKKLVDTLETYLQAGCVLKPEYEAKIDRFFPLHDTDNCKRIYEHIINLNK